MDLQKEKQIKQQMEAEKAKAAQVAPKVEERPVKLRKVLSEFFMKRRERIDPELLQQLKETARREATEADQYGSYKPGTFTFGAFVVDVTHDDGLWRIEIISGENGGKVPENIVEQIRYKYVPNDAWMCKIYAPREAQRGIQGVLLLEMPMSTKEEE